MDMVNFLLKNKTQGFQYLFNTQYLKYILKPEERCIRTLAGITQHYAYNLVAP